MHRRPPQTQDSLPGWPVASTATTQAADASVMAAWRADERPFYVAVLLLHDDGVLRQRRRSVLRALGPWCSAAAPDQPHLTLAAVGTDTGAARRAHEAAGVSLTVRIGGADAFSSAVFLHASGPKLADLRRAVLRAAGPEPDAPATWVPHVTVGTFQQSVPMPQVRTRLEPFRRLAPVSVTGSTAVLQVDRSSPAGRLLPAGLDRAD